ncbi:unnamed protein product [Amoebophrya sp. A25]|nr:unnamed protein product [Amoebophrya sp. A25]|eukprot:GSA25T00005156001.1
MMSDAGSSTKSSSPPIGFEKRSKKGGHFWTPLDARENLPRHVANTNTAQLREHTTTHTARGLPERPTHFANTPSGKVQREVGAVTKCCILAPLFLVKWLAFGVALWWSLGLLSFLLQSMSGATLSSSPSSSDTADPWLVQSLRGTLRGRTASNDHGDGLSLGEQHAKGHNYSSSFDMVSSFFAMGEKYQTEFGVAIVSREQWCAAGWHGCAKIPTATFNLLSGLFRIMLMVFLYLLSDRILVRLGVVDTDGASESEHQGLFGNRRPQQSYATTDGGEQTAIGQDSQRREGEASRVTDTGVENGKNGGTSMAFVPNGELSRKQVLGDIVLDTANEETAERLSSPEEDGPLWVNIYTSSDEEKKTPTAMSDQVVTSSSSADDAVSWRRNKRPSTVNPASAGRFKIQLQQGVMPPADGEADFSKLTNRSHSSSSTKASSSTEAGATMNLTGSATDQDHQGTGGPVSPPTNRRSQRRTDHSTSGKKLRSKRRPSLPGWSPHDADGTIKNTSTEVGSAGVAKKQGKGRRQIASGDRYLSPVYYHIADASDESDGWSSEDDDEDDVDSNSSSALDSMENGLHGLERASAEIEEKDYPFHQ